VVAVSFCELAGLGLALSGYTDGALAYWEACLRVLTSMEWTEPTFARLRDQLMLEYRYGGRQRRSRIGQATAIG